MAFLNSRETLDFDSPIAPGTASTGLVVSALRSAAPSERAPRPPLRPSRGVARTMRASPLRPGPAPEVLAPDAAGRPTSPTRGCARAGIRSRRPPFGRAAARPAPLPLPRASGSPPPVQAESAAGSAPLAGPAPAPGSPPNSSRSVPQAAGPSCPAQPASASFPSVASFLFCWSRGVLAHPRYLRSEAASISTKDGTHSSRRRLLTWRSWCWPRNRKQKTAWKGPRVRAGREGYFFEELRQVVPE